MKNINAIFALAAVVAVTNTYAQIPDQNLVKTTCPALTALKHAGPGAPWTLDQKASAAGFYVVQTPDAVDSKLISFDKMYGGLSVYFSDRKFQAPLEVTCQYESGDDVVFVRSKYSYDPMSVMQNANQYPDKYSTHENTVTECAKGFANGDFGPGTEHICEWNAYIVNAVK